MITYRIHLIRSGSTMNPSTKNVIGRESVPLDEKSVEFLNLMWEKFSYPKVDLLYSSPLPSCTDTAKIIYPDIRPVIKDGLVDMNLGEFEGRTYEELKDDVGFKEWIKDSVNNTPPYGENVQEFTSRVLETTNEIFTEMINFRATAAAVVVHSGFIMTLLSSVGIPRLPMDSWISENGTGFTLSTSTQMWMRDGAAEVIGNIPTLD